MAKYQAMIALGGNMGDVQAAFDSACIALKQHCTIIQQSKLYQTPALTQQGAARQADYLNAVVEVATSLAALELLHFLHEIEAKHGRQRSTKWAARTLDLDLLTYQHSILDTEQLTLPHPQLTKRLFVLQPLADISPFWKHPVSQQPISSMIKALIPDNNGLFEGTLWTTSG